ESGSGKSTLLNVISGLDTYEEGEMYINGEETSHYTEKDFEDYRRKYIGNIFQSFNLVNSYTVYQNIELVMLLNGSKRKEIKARVNELIDTVGLTEYKHTKASKLSGGQKQRVAIARALAKDTPIIIADEPTGNLDTESAAGIIELLASIAKDKLVIVVTHNFDQVAPYVTRKIKMHDGKVLEDVRMNQDTVSAEPEQPVDYAVSYKNIRPLSELRLGIRNAFNIPVKFILITFVFLFVAIALIVQLASSREVYSPTNGAFGFNYYFHNSAKSRIIVKKQAKDGVAQPFTDADLAKIKKLDNVNTVFEQDLLLDQSMGFENDEEGLYIYGSVTDISDYKLGDPDYGRMPQSDDEILIVAVKSSYAIPKGKRQIGQLLDTSFYRYGSERLDKDHPYKIAGIKYIDDADQDPVAWSEGAAIYCSGKLLDEIKLEINKNYGTLKVVFQDKTYTNEQMWPMFTVRTSDKVEEGTCWVSDDYNWLVKNTYNAKDKPMKFELKTPYYEDSLEVTISKIYNKNEFTDAFKIPEGSTYDDYKGYILVNPNDLNKLYDHDTYQISIFVKDAVKAKDTLKEINNMGYDAVSMQDLLYSLEEAALINLITKVMLLGLAVVLLLISYFVIRIILKSRNVYFSTIRMLGSNVSTARNLIIIDLMTDAAVAFGLAVAGVWAFLKYLPTNDLALSIKGFVGMSDYVLIFVLVIAMAFIIAARYANRLFKKSSIQTIKEEV
ncbi:MAG: ABC transporter ATP-binding protein, partial [Clostridia bacterium]|nr:ABC transporter ATP-binding protein [Clostridia bacterium]